MNKLLRITATVDRPKLLETMVEKLAQRHSRLAYSKKFEACHWQSFDSSSIETFVNGSLVFDAEDNTASSFTTSFLFTCLKQKQTGYKLRWSVSLS